MEEQCNMERKSIELLPQVKKCQLRNCVLQEKYKHLKCEGTFVNGSAIIHYTKDFNCLGKWDFVPKEFDTTENDIRCNLCRKFPFNKMKQGKRFAVIKHIALEHGLLLKAFINEGEMEKEIEFLASIDHKFNKQYHEHFGKTLLPVNIATAES